MFRLSSLLYNSLSVSKKPKEPLLWKTKFWVLNTLYKSSRLDFLHYLNLLSYFSLEILLSLLFLLYATSFLGPDYIHTLSCSFAQLNTEKVQPYLIHYRQNLLYYCRAKNVKHGWFRLLLLLYISSYSWLLIRSLYYNMCSLDNFPFYLYLSLFDTCDRRQWICPWILVHFYLE